MELTQEYWLLRGSTLRAVVEHMARLGFAAAWNSRDRPLPSPSSFADSTEQLLRWKRRHHVALDSQQQRELYFVRRDFRDCMAQFAAPAPRRSAPSRGGWYLYQQPVFRPGLRLRWRRDVAAGDAGDAGDARGAAA